MIGCGDVALRVAPLLTGRFRVLGLIRNPDRAGELRAAGVVPVIGDLDDARSLGRLAGLADLVLHFAPPPDSGERDPRTRRLLAALGRSRMLPRRLLYISTTGVYGDCQGERVPEVRPVQPSTPRAKRRIDAERRLRHWGVARGVGVSVLRVPGIYAADRVPVDRVRSGTPVLSGEDDGYTNHIHADDLARIVVTALLHGRPGRVYNTADESGITMGDYFELIADAWGLPRPQRISRAEAASRIPIGLLSYMLESRRIVSDRMRRELGVKLRYPTVLEGLAAAAGESR